LKTDFNTLVINALNESEYVTKKHLMSKISKSFPDLSPTAVNWRLHKLKANGLIQSPNYGTYSLKGVSKNPI
jgi:Fe2+ or Zn2+ uptake regulation protein